MLNRSLQWLLTSKDHPNALHRAIFRQTFFTYVRKAIRNVVADGDRVLDVGGREFLFTWDLPCRELWGIDLISESEGELGWTESFLNLAKREGIHLTIANAEEIPFPSRSIDKVILTEVLEHIENDDRAIDEIRRVLRKGGAFLMTTPNADEVPNTNPFHLRHYGISELKGLLERHFGSVQVKRMFPWGSFYEMQFRYEKNRFLSALLAHVYNLFLALFGQFLADRGYILAAICKEPRGDEAEYPVKVPLERVCPACKGRLAPSGERLQCGGCGSAYGSNLGIPVLLTRVPHHQTGGR
jgi:SAM-dependent methyltransferase